MSGTIGIDAQNRRRGIVLGNGGSVLVTAVILAGLRPLLFAQTTVQAERNGIAFHRQVKG